jgi:hypothetical protein
VYTLDFTAVIAIALVALVLVFIRISWTLKEMSDTLASRNASATKDETASRAIVNANAANAALASAEAHDADSSNAGPDETELAAVIAIAHAAYREAV